MTEDHYKKYRKLIYKAAWKRTKVTGQDFHDLVGEGNLAYCEALETWDPEKGAFSTHLTWKLKERFKRAISFNKYEELDTFPEIIGPGDPFTACAFKRGLETLGSDAKEIINTIFTSSGELCDMTINSIRVTKKNIFRYYRTKKWGRNKITHAMNEIKIMLLAI
jgi:hypothetical protein